MDAFSRKIRSVFATYAVEDARLLAEVRLLLAARREVLLREVAGDGLALARSLAGTADALISAWFAAARGARGLAVLALGGYGRGELCPQSDLDLLLLYPANAEARAREHVGALVAFLWDLGCAVGHAARAVEECAAVMDRDLPSATALLEARLLAGSRVLFRRFEEEVTGPFLAAHGDGFIAKKIEEAEARHRFYGGSPRITVPNVKESPGGLRDLHVAGWIALALSGRKDLEVYREAGLLPEGEDRALVTAYGDVLRIRHALHVLAGRKQDTLDFAVRPEAARLLGIGAGEGFSASERVAHVYCRAALRISRFLSRVVRFRRGCPVGAVRRPLSPAVFALGGEAWPAAADAVAGAAGAISAAALSAEHGLAPAPELLEACAAAVARLTPAERSSPAAARAFLDLLAAPSAGAALRTLDEAGFLGEFLPEFGRVAGLAREDPMHRFTVDEHTLRAVENLSALAEKDEGLREECARVERPDLLRLALLLHDVGKGLGRGHVERGTAMVPEVAARLGLADDDARLVRFLVEKHLLISALADRRQPGEAAAALAAEVGDRGRLRCLYLLTVADVAAAGPGSLSGWRAAQLRRLYDEARGRLATRAERPWRERVLEAVGSEQAADAADHLSRMGARYVLEVDPSRVALHLALARRLASAPAALTALSEPTHAEVWVAARDAPGLFARLAGCLSVHDLDIEAAAAYTRDDGVALDVFFVTREGAAPPADEGFWRGVSETLCLAVAGGIDLAAEIGRHRRRYRPEPQPEPLPAPPDARASDRIAERYTVVEVTAGDRPALLHDLAAAIAAAGLSIHHAVVATRGRLAMDTFYLARPDGSPPGEARVEPLLAVLRRLAAGAPE